MTVTAKVQPIDQAVILELVGTPAERSAILAQFARETLTEAQDEYRQALGAVPPHQTSVDGALGASEDAVKPDGVIVYDFDLLSQIAAWIEGQLVTHSPVGGPLDHHPGLYQRSHRIYADGQEVSASDIPLNAKELVFAPTVPYADLIEPHGGGSGELRQAPDGVYQAIAALARARYPGVNISFEFRPVSGVSNQQPAIVITL